MSFEKIFVQLLIANSIPYLKYVQNTVNVQYPGRKMTIVSQRLTQSVPKKNTIRQKLARIDHRIYICFWYDSRSQY